MSTRNLDPVPGILRTIEARVDNFYKSNPLINLPFGIAAWYYMAFCEDVAAKPLTRGHQQSIHETATSADLFVNQLKNPFQWLYSCCAAGGVPPCAYDGRYYQASWDLFKIAENYGAFEAAFTYASRGLIELSLEGSTILSTADFGRDARYEAYDRLVGVDCAPSDFSIGNLFELVEPSVKVSGELFSYNLNPKLVSQVIKVAGPVATARYSLPADWMFEHFSLEDFRRISDCLLAISFIHFAARITATAKGCVGLGYSNSIFLSGTTDLGNRLARYSGCDTATVLRLIQLNTYGEMGVTSPDPAVQPIVRLNQNTYALMPSLFIRSSVERNFTIVLNKLTSERAVYSRLVLGKEGLMREGLKAGLSIPELRFFHGRMVGDLPDVDLAIISDVEKSCLILEMKWFIAPAEVREVIEKSEEISKGVSQSLQLSNALHKNPSTFFQRMGVDSSYGFLFAVVSDSFIGLRSVQNPEIPVVRLSHLIRKANSLHSLRKTMGWLSNREYLPVEGKHYETVEKVWKVGEWGIKWYGIRPLLEGEFV